VTDQQRELLATWKGGLHRSLHGHYEAAKVAERKHYYLGVPAAVLSGIVGASVFAAINSTPEVWAIIVVGSISILSSILISLQTFLRFDERAESHRKCGVRYGSLDKEIAHVLVAPPMDDKKFDLWMATFRERWDELAAESPTIPNKVAEFVERRYPMSSAMVKHNQENAR
jgi:hypothetical protein